MIYQHERELIRKMIDRSSRYTVVAYIGTPLQYDLRWEVCASLSAAHNVLARIKAEREDSPMYLALLDSFASTSVSPIPSHVRRVMLQYLFDTIIPQCMPELLPADPRDDDSVDWMRRDDLAALVYKNGHVHITDTEEYFGEAIDAIRLGLWLSKNPLGDGDVLAHINSVSAAFACDDPDPEDWAVLHAAHKYLKARSL